MYITSMPGHKDILMSIYTAILLVHKKKKNGIWLKVIYIIKPHVWHSRLQNTLKHFGFLVDDMQIWLTV